MTRLHGSYEVADGRLKLAFDTTGKRVNRPLELKPSAPDQVLFFDVKATKEPQAPPGATPKGADRPEPAAPAPKPRPARKAGGKMFCVPPGEMSLRDVARLTLGSDQRWEEISRLNPQVQPEGIIPEGTILLLPADARIPE